MKRLVKTLAVLAVLFLFGVLSVAGVIFYISTDLPQINSLKDYNPPMNSKILSKDGEVLMDVGVETRDVVNFKDIPPKVVDAFLAAEDDNFYNHEGIDYYGIMRAFIVNLKEGRLVQGGSTITQQVAKSFLLTKERTFSRKIKDLLLARKIEQKFSKEEILFLYLNQVYLGGGYYGVKAALKGYFNKELEEATPAESALVAGLLVAPGRYSPYVNPQYAKVRQTYVLKRMFETNKITEEEYQAALKEDIKMRIRRPNEVKGGHFTDWVRQEVIKLVGNERFLTDGLTVVTTMDWSLQSKAEKSVRENVKELDKRQGFKGPIKHLGSDDEIIQHLTDQRKKMLRSESSFFTFTVEGKNIFEFNEDNNALDPILAYYDGEAEKLNERFKKIVSIGNPASDVIGKFFKVGNTYPAVVLETDNLKRTILVSIAGYRGVINEAGFSWAHPRDFGPDPVYHGPVKVPSKIVKRGDVIEVKIEQLSVPHNQLIHNDFFDRYKDPKVLEIISLQTFFKGSLDQEPEAEGALIALNPNSGEVITLVGGVDFQKSQFNRVIQSSRQPGSAFKPFIYAAALENGYTPSSILMDSPQALAGVDESLSWKPRNYDGDFKGPMTLRHALEVSRNVPTVRLVQDLGISKVHDFIRRMKINAQVPKDMSLALGSFGISLAELTKGFAIFPNGGRAIRMKHIISIKDRTGKTYTVPMADEGWPAENSVATETINENPFLKGLSGTQVYDKRLAYLMTNILNGVTLYGTGARASKLSHNLGGKTGTTNNYVDALFVGFSANLVVGTWAGFDDNRSLGFPETGTKAALPIWIDYMTGALPKYGDPDFNVPDGITQLLINKATGKPLPPGSGEGFLESYVAGFDPLTETKEFFDQSTQDASGKPDSIDDGSYWENQ